MAGSGTVRTVALKCTGPTLVVTADVLEDGGSVRVGLAGASSKGLKPSDAVPVTGSTTDHAVAFAAGKTLAGLVGQDVVLELVLDRIKRLRILPEQAHDGVHAALDRDERVVQPGRH